MNTILPVLLVSIVSIVGVANAQVSTACTSSMITTFTPCLNYVTGSSTRGTSPTQDCCDAVKSIMADGVDCACLIVTGNVPLSIPFANRNLAISLPRMCRTSVPVQCKASGDQLPAPGPALFGPSSSPTASAPSGQEGSAGNEAESPAAGFDLAPTASSEPPDVRSDPGQGIKPVLNPNSSSSPNRSVVTLSNLVLMFVAIIAAFKFL